MPLSAACAQWLLRQMGGPAKTCNCSFVTFQRASVFRYRHGLFAYLDASHVGDVKPGAARVMRCSAGCGTGVPLILSSVLGRCFVAAGANGVLVQYSTESTWLQVDWDRLWDLFCKGPKHPI